MQRRRPPEAALSQTVRGYAEHPKVLHHASRSAPDVGQLAATTGKPKLYNPHHLERTLLCRRADLQASPSPLRCYKR